MKIKHIMSNREEKVMEHLWENEAAMTITELDRIINKGEFVDVALYAVLRSDWEKTQR